MGSSFWLGPLLLAQASQLLGPPPDSPCPELFRYELNPAGWRGVVRLLAPPRFSTLHLDLSLAAAEHLPEDLPPGNLTLRGGVQAARAVVRAALEGRRKAIEFVADFPCGIPAPKLLNITVNGKLFCSALKEPDDMRSIISLSASLETGLDVPADNHLDFSIAPDDRSSESISVAPDTTSTIPCVNMPLMTEMLTENLQNTPPQRYVPEPTTPQPSPPSYTNSGSWTQWLPPSIKPRPLNPIIRRPLTTSAPSVKASDTVQGCGRPAVSANLLVTGGTASKRGLWPWQAALFKKVEGRRKVGLDFQCGASLLTTRYVLTAAHCVESRNRPGRPQAAASFVVYLGKHDLLSYTEPGQQTAEVDSVQMHPDYGASSKTYDCDIALLLLSAPVHLSEYVHPVCLWAGPPSLDIIKGQIGVVPGWGHDDTGALSNELRVANMPVVSQEDCLRSDVFYTRFTSDKTFCAGFKNGTSLCNGDSGGGLYLRTSGSGRWMIRGIVSVSKFNVNDQSCDSYNYIVFTDVAKFLPWLYYQMANIPA